MCLTFFCLKPPTNPQISFMMFFNRQQQTLRPALPLAPFAGDPNIWAGRDIKSGGTWLGLNIKTGLLVFLTNYDLTEERFGRSRGQLVAKFLSSQFAINEGLNMDQSIYSLLGQVQREGKEYSAFNLTIYNIRTDKMFYICSQWESADPRILNLGQTYGICNSDIDTIWPKTEFGLKKFEKIVDNLSSMPLEKIFFEMELISRDKTRFSEIDDDQSSIFVQPYWCKLQNAERMTRSTFMLVITEAQGERNFTVQEISYASDLTQSRKQMLGSIHIN